MPRKRKGILYPDWLRMEDALRLSGDNGIAAADLMRATIRTGLRPCEWLDTTWPYAPRWVLRVKNAKAGGPHNRANGSHREITLPPDLGTADQRALIQTWERARAWKAEGVYDARMAVLRVTVARVARRVFPSGPWPSVYSARHTYSSNTKADLPLVHVSAALGHASEASAKRHYGRRRNAWKPTQRGSPAAPSAESVAAVRRTVDHFVETPGNTFTPVR